MRRPSTVNRLLLDALQQKDTERKTVDRKTAVLKARPEFKS
jgi:hypothetical protein